MKVAKSLFLCLGILLCASCAQQDEELGTSLNRSPLEKVTVTAGPILPPPSTRVTTEREGQVTHFNWNKGDVIALATSSQFLPYITTESGAKTSFLSAFTGSDNADDYLNHSEGEVVYARYPYDTDRKIDLETFKTPVTQDEPFLYAIGEIHNGQLNLQFQHAFAYLQFDVSFEEFSFTDDNLPKLYMEWNCDDTDILPLKIDNAFFNYKTGQIEYSNWDDDWDLLPNQYMDKSRLFPVLPVPDGYSLYLEVEDENSENWVYTGISKVVPVGGLKAGHIYNLELIFRGTVDERSFLLELFMEGNGKKWLNNTNWLTDKSYNEWYGVMTDAEGHVTEIDLSNNNLTGCANLNFSDAPYLTKCNIDNNSFNNVCIRSGENFSDYSLNHCQIHYNAEFYDFNTLTLTDCAVRDELYIESCGKVYIDDCSCGSFYGFPEHGLHIKNSTIGLTRSSDLGVSSYADVIFENVTINYLDSTHEPVTLTKTFKGSEWQAIFNEAFGIQ